MMVAWTRVVEAEVARSDNLGYTSICLDEVCKVRGKEISAEP